MTYTEIVNWINYHVKKKITAPVMNEALHKLVDFLAPIDNPLNPYTITISNNDLNENKEILITHGRGTWLPDFIITNEKGLQIFSEYYDAVPVSENAILFTFNDDIPATDLGYYKLALWFVCNNVEPRLTELIYLDFDTDDDFTGIILPTMGTGQGVYVQDGNLLIVPGYSPLEILLDLNLAQNQKYKLTIKIMVGGLIMTRSSNPYSMLSTDDDKIFNINFTHSGGFSKIGFKNFNSSEVYVDYLRLQKVE